MDKYEILVALIGWACIFAGLIGLLYIGHGFGQV